MESSYCQRCKKKADPLEGIPKILQCGCFYCPECIQADMQYFDHFICENHKEIYQTQKTEQENFLQTKIFDNQIKDFQKEANLLEIMQKFSQILNSTQIQFFSYKKNILRLQNFFIDIIKQVCHQTTRNYCEQIQNKIRLSAEIVQNLRNQIQNLEKVVELNSESQQQYEQRMTLLKQVHLQYKQIKQMIFSSERAEVEEENINKKNKEINKNCFNAIKFIMVKMKNSNYQHQNVAAMVNEYFQQISQYDFTMITRENVKKFIENFTKQSMLGFNMKENPLNKTNICYNQDILNQFKQNSSQTLIQKLNEVIEVSKTDKEIEQASANAITILKYMNYNFIQKNYEGIRIKGADLSEYSFQNCNFRGANMQEVNLRNASLTNCNLNGADLRNVLLESPESLDILQGHSDSVYSVAISSNMK